jgi:hypothetical protein
MHTPGPWTLKTVPTTIGSCHTIGPFPGPSETRPETHACVYADNVRIGFDEKNPRAVELLANAKLIAAAPDLLAALKALHAKPTPGTLEQALAAIAKAES